MGKVSFQDLVNKMRQSAPEATTKKINSPVVEQNKNSVVKNLIQEVGKLLDFYFKKPEPAKDKAAEKEKSTPTIRPDDSKGSWYPQNVGLPTDP